MSMKKMQLDGGRSDAPAGKGQDGQQSTVAASALKELPSELRIAVAKFRIENGRLWKARLLSGWLKSSYPGELQQVRNQYGPEWLRRVKENDFDQAIVTNPEGSGIRGNEAPTLLHERIFDGEAGNARHMTRRELVVIPIAALADFHGSRGEQREYTTNADGERRFGNFSEADWEKFKSSLNADGMDEPITINIDCDEPISIYEGNHRLQGAKHSGWTVIAAEIRYFGHAETRFTGGSFFRQTMAAIASAAEDEKADLRPPRVRM